MAIGDTIAIIAQNQSQYGSPPGTASLSGTVIPAQPTHIADFDSITADSSTLNGLTVTATTGTLTIANAKTLTASNTITFTATDGSTLAIGTGGTLGTGAYATIASYATLASPTFTGAPAIAAATGTSLVVTGALKGQHQDLYTAITGDGAITVAPGLIGLSKGSAAAITLAAPTTGTHDGYILSIVALSAFAHVVTFPSGKINGGSLVTATFGGAVGDAITIKAIAGVWYTTCAPRNVTIA